MLRNNRIFLEIEVFRFAFLGESSMNLMCLINRAAFGNTVFFIGVLSLNLVEATFMDIN